MSHVATVQLEINSLDDLAAAAQAIGLEFVQGQTTYRWYGESVGDTPLPAGFAVEDLGRCEHALRVPLDQEERLFQQYRERPYEVGVCRRRDGKPGWVLLWDYFYHGMGLTQFVGQECARLKQAYATVAARRTMIQQGYRCTEIKLPSGAVQLQFTM